MKFSLLPLSIAITACFAGQAFAEINVAQGDTYASNINTTEKLINNGTISNSEIIIKGGQFNNYGTINTNILDLLDSPSLGTVSGEINAKEAFIYRGTGSNSYGKSLSAKLNTDLFNIIGGQNQTGFSITDNEVLAGVKEIKIESNGARTGLKFTGQDLKVTAPITLQTNDGSGGNRVRLEVTDGSSVYFESITDNSADGQLSLLHFSDSSSVEVANLTVNSEFRLTSWSNSDDAKSDVVVGNVTLNEGALFRTNLQAETSLEIGGSPTFTLEKGAVVDLGYKNEGGENRNLLISAESMTFNVADSSRDSGTTIYIGKDVIVENTEVKVNGLSSNNTGNAEEDLASLADLVKITSTDDVVEVIEGEKLSGTVVYQEGNDIYDASSATVTDKGLSNIQTHANANVYGIAEMASLGLHIWRNEINDMNKRLGELRDSAADQNGVWARVYNGKAKFGNQDITNKYTSFQFGYDRQVTPGVWLGGAMSYTDGNNDFNRGGGDNNLYAFTGYGSWLSDSGLFLDVTGKIGRMKNSFDIGLDSGEMSSGDYKTNAVSMSAELGWRFYPVSNVFVEPQVEMMYGHVFDADYTTSTGLNVKHDSAETLIGRVGFVLGLDCPSDRGNAYIRASVLHDWKGEADYSFAKGTAHRSLSEDLGGTWYEYGLGANFNVTKQAHVYADVEASNGGEVDTDYRVNLGVRYSF